MMIPTNVNQLTIKEFIEYENIRTSSLENIDKIIHSRVSCFVGFNSC